MSKENKDSKKVNTNAEGTPDPGEDVEGYAYCDTTKSKCLNDCINPLPNAFISDIN